MLADHDRCPWLRLPLLDPMRLYPIKAVARLHHGLTLSVFRSLSSLSVTIFLSMEGPLRQCGASGASLVGPTSASARRNLRSALDRSGKSESAPGAS